LKPSSQRQQFVESSENGDPDADESESAQLPTSRQYPCLYCGERFDTPKDWEKHTLSRNCGKIPDKMFKRLKNELIPEGFLPVLPITKTDEQNNRSKKQGVVHEDPHKPRRIIKDSHRKDSLSQSLITEADLKHICAYCGEEFDKSIQLKEHMLSGLCKSISEEELHILKELDATGQNHDKSHTD